MTVNISVTFPEPVLEWIDKERGAIKRSTYVIKLLQQTRDNKTDNFKKLPKKEGIERAAATAPRYSTMSATDTTTELAKERGCISNNYYSPQF
jgi:hypothetical protein